MTKLWGFTVALLLIGATAGMAKAGNATLAKGGSGAHAVAMAAGTTASGVSIRTKKRTTLTFQRVTIDPGGSTGWHTHPGQLLVVVASGELTRSTANCRSRTYRAGDALIERGGHDVHEGRNLGSVPVELYVTYVIASGRPLRQDARAPSCGF
jgi:quercetin dioxygenase-like cupin family protein